VTNVIGISLLGRFVGVVLGCNGELVYATGCNWWHWLTLWTLHCIAAGEQASEEEESGVDEEFDSTLSPSKDTRKTDTNKRTAKRTKTLLPRLL